MMQYLLPTHDTLNSSMMQSVMDDRDDSGVDFFVEVDGTAAHVSIINDDQASTEFVTNFQIVVEEHSDEDFRGDEMQQGIVLNFQANETPTYIAASDTSYINHPNHLLEPSEENPFGDPVPSSFFDTPSSLRHLPIQCAKFQYGTTTYFILSVFILTGLLRFRILYNRFRKTLKKSQVVESIKSDAISDNIMPKLDDSKMKVPHEQSSDIDDVRGVVPVSPTVPAHVIPELDCNKIVIPLMQSAPANEVNSTVSTPAIAPTLALAPAQMQTCPKTEHDDRKDTIVQDLRSQFLVSALVYCLLAVQRNETYPSISNIFKYNYDIDLVAFYNFLRYLVPICSAICSSGSALDDYQTMTYRNGRVDTFSFNQIFVSLNDYLNPISGMNLRVWYNKIGASIPENIQPCLKGLYRTMIGPFVFSLFFTFLFSLFRIPRSWSRNVFHLGFLWNIKCGLVSLLLNQFSVVLLLALCKILVHRIFHSRRPMNLNGYEKFLWNFSQILSFLESIVVGALMGAHHARYHSRSFLYGDVGSQLNFSRTISDYSDMKSLRALHNQVVCCLGHIGD